MLYNIPIETITMRYSYWWNQWFPKEFERLGVKYKTIYPEDAVISNTIRKGAFLDVIGTNVFKSKQLQMLLLEIENGNIKDNDVLFFHDLWFPGIEALAYVRDALKMKFRITGFIHAGVYDEHDYLNKCGMKHWASNIEYGWFKIFDTIFTASEFHRMLLKQRFVLEEKVCVISNPMFETVPYDHDLKKDIVVFPHRLDDEKRPFLFDELAQKYFEKFPEHFRSVSFVRTKDLGFTSLESYLEFLATCKVAVSFGPQENFGNAMHEALYVGCYPICLNVASYNEFFPVVDDLNKMVIVINNALTYETERRHDVQKYQEFLLPKTTKCIENICRILRLI